MKRQAIYALSGDPIHYGHIDIVERASKIFDKVVVGIGVNLSKKYLFSLEERLDLVRKALVSVPNVEVKSFQGLLVDYAAENGIATVVKGIRGESDLDYELMLHHVGESQRLGIDTFFIPAKQEMTHFSSSAVKALQIEQGLVHGYVPLNVKQALEEKMSGQHILGLTGEIGVGKSYVGKRFETLAKNKGLEAHNIELDSISHQILGELKEELYADTRDQIAAEFGECVRTREGIIDRKALGEIVFHDSSKMNRLNQLMYTPLLVKLRRELYGKKGLIILNAALLAESKMTYLCNNNVVLVSAKEEIQARRLEQRDLSPDQVLRRKESQYDTEEKASTLRKRIELDRHGKLWELDNSEGKEEIDETLCDVLNYFNLGGENER